ncbi:MAG: iron-sulfur cluster insertion protein ErpA [Deltaproteobacteria bacterium]|nr:iron-sulfur cluster insertion protein ErpA [Deltaproteobacteria bacterium]
MNPETESFDLPSVGSQRPILDVTESAAKRVKTFAEQNKEAAGKQFRVYIQGGGCSGFEYGFKFDDQRDDDLALEFHGIKVLLDPASLNYLKGSTVDWVEDFRGSGFVVRNPNATGTCGCGTSFSV